MLTNSFPNGVYESLSTVVTKIEIAESKFLHKERSCSVFFSLIGEVELKTTPFCCVFVERRTMNGISSEETSLKFFRISFQSSFNSGRAIGHESILRTSRRSQAT